MIVLGVNAIGHHDASACIVRDGVLVAFIEEERLSRVKHAVAQRPVNAVHWCLQSQGLAWQDIDVLATPWVEEEHGVIAPAGYDPQLSFSYREGGRDVEHWPRGLHELFAETGGNRAKAPALLQVSHHLAHAASAYWCAGMPETTILVVDGEGDRISTTVAHGRHGVIAPLRQFSTVDSLGQFYACMTEFIGFGDFGEGKLMGLAPHGTASIEFPEIVRDIDGGYRIDIPGSLPRFDPVGGDWQAVIAGWMKVLVDRFGAVRPARDQRSASELKDWPQIDRDLAASAQLALQETLAHVARAAIKATGSANLVLAGGVALNCAMNGHLADMPEINRFFVQPVAGDNGAPIGAALHAAALSGDQPMTEWRTASLGPSYADDECATALKEAGLRHRPSSDIAADAAALLADGKVVCWFQGALEAGPRALGHRSIVASPSSERLRDKVNDVKRRSHWRPLAPSVREQDRSIFAAGRSSPFMIVADQVKAEWRSRLPGITHVDSTARPQTVDENVDPLYWRLIDQHMRSTGLPAIINTSFNCEDEPIVCTPSDAIRSFLRGGADTLCLGPFLINHPTRIRP